MSNKKALSKSDLLMGKLVEVEISEDTCIYLGPLKTSTARNLVKVISGRKSDNMEDNVDMIWTDEMTEAIAESALDENRNQILSKEEVLQLPLEHYMPIAKALIERMNSSTSGKGDSESANENESGFPLVKEESIERPSEMTISSDSLTGLEERTKL